MSSLVWSPERIERLAQLWNKGLSASVVARLLGDGLSKNAVIGKVHRLRRTDPALVTRPAAPARPGFVVLEIYRHLWPAPRRVAIRLDPDSPLTFAELPEVNSCHYPVSDDGSPTLFCGRWAPDNFQYCAQHWGVVYQSPAASKKTNQRLELAK